MRPLPSGEVGTPSTFEGESACTGAPLRRGDSSKGFEELPAVRSSPARYGVPTRTCGISFHTMNSVVSFGNSA